MPDGRSLSLHRAGVHRACGKERGHAGQAEDYPEHDLDGEDEHEGTFESLNAKTNAMMMPTKGTHWKRSV